MKSLTGLFCVIITLFSLSDTAYSKPIGYWKSYTCVDGLAGGVIRSMVEDNDGNLWITTEGDGVSRYDGISFHNYTKESTNNGLVSNFVYSAFKDKKGNLWFATWGGGVCRFNGKSFDKTLTTENGLVSNFVLTIYQDSKENLWFGTKGGINIYDGTKITTFVTMPKEVSVSAILEDSAKYMWFGITDGNIYKYKADKSKIQVFNPNNKKISSIIEDRHGNLWIGTWKGLYKYDNKQFLPFALNGHVIFDNVYVEFILEDSKGNLWFGTDSGVKKFNGSYIEAFQSNKDELLEKWVTAIVEDRDGKLWFGTWGSGICQYDNSIQHYTLSNTISKNQITSAIEDHNGNLWFTTKGEGVFRFDGKALQNIKEPDHFTIKDGMISDEIDSVIKDNDGNLWFSGIKGMTKYNGETFKAIRFAFSSEAKVIPLLMDKKGNLWLDIQKNRYTIEIVKYNKGNAQPFPLEIPKQAYNTVSVTLEDKSGNIWFGTESDGIYRYKDGIVDHFKSEETKELDGNMISSITEDAKGNVWFGLLGNDKPEYSSKTRGGLSMYNGITFQSFSTKDGLGNNSVTSIMRDKNNNLWFGTWHGGVSKYDGTKFTNFTTEYYDLASNTINYLLCEKKRKCLWFGTQSGGVSQYDEQNFQTLTIENGLLKNWVKPIIEDDKGNIWFIYYEAEPGRLTKYTPRKSLPKVQITQVVADNIYENTNEIKMPSSVRYVFFHFKDLTISQLNSTKYIYKLEGSESEKEWQTTKNRQVEYKNLKSGKYVFVVKSIDRDFNYSVPESVVLTVVPLWYQRPFYIIPIGLLGVMFLVAFVYVSWKYTVHNREAQQLRLLMLEQERQKNMELQEANRHKRDFLAKMSHDIRTPLNAILGYAHLLKRNHDLQNDMRNGLESIESSGKHLRELINDILDISKIESGSEELQNKNFDLKEMIKGISIINQIRCEEKGLNWRVEWQKKADEEGEAEIVENTHKVIHGVTDRKSIAPPDHIIINGDQVKLRKILSNLLSNAVKFTESGEIIIRIILPSKRQFDELKNNMPIYDQKAMYHISNILLFTFEVIDTGVGIPEEERSIIFEQFQQGGKGKTRDGIGLGLAIAKDYIELMGGRLYFDSIPYKGSRFFFTLPFQLIPDDISQPSYIKKSVTHLASEYKVKAIVVDDIEENREILAKILSGIGVQAIIAEGGIKAIEHVHSSPPDIIFMDIHMDPIDGIETAKQIWKEFGHETIKIVAVSASAFAHDQERYRSEGFIDFIAKPFLAEEIYDCLANILHVEYEYTDLEFDLISSLELEKITLPTSLLTLLKEAVEFGAITDFRNYLDEAKQHSEEGQRLAEYLYPLIRSHNIEEILNILSRIQQE